MPTQMKMLALDIDGTTFDPKQVITPRVKKAIQTACEQGIIVLPATGRTFAGIPPEFTDIPGVDYALTSNGAAVYKLEPFTELYSDCLSAARAIEIVEQASKFDCIMAAYINGHGYNQITRETELERFVSKEMMIYFEETKENVDDLAQEIKKMNHHVEKINLIFPNVEVCRATHTFFSQFDDLFLTSSIRDNVEINKQGCNKGVSLLALAKQLNIKQEEIMAIGDGDNDIEMLKMAGLGIAMGNANKEIKEAADDVTLTNSEDGVAVAIEKILLNK